MIMSVLSDIISLFYLVSRLLLNLEGLVVVGVVVWVSCIWREDIVIWLFSVVSCCL